MREAEPQAAKPTASAPAVRRPAQSDMTLVEIERADRHPPRGHLLEQLTIRLVLHVFRGRLERLTGQQELRAVQADAIGAGLLQEWEIRQQFQVRVQPHGHAVSRRQRFARGGDRQHGGAAATRRVRRP